MKLLSELIKTILKYSSKIFFPFIIAVTLSPSMKAQDQGVVYDSLKVKSFDGQKFKFVLEDSLLKKVSITISHPKHVKIKGKHVFGDLGRGMLTIMSGIGTEDSKEDIDLKFITRIRCKERKFDWNINIYCRGTMDKELNRNQNEDGGFSLSVDHYAYINWDQGVWGEILKGEQKIGEFILIKNMNSNISFNGPLSFLNELNQKYTKEGDTEDEKMKGININDYAIIGDLYGQKFRVIHNSEEKRISIHQNNSIKTKLQALDSSPSSSGQNYFLFKDSEVSEWESTYWSKLALFFEYLNRTVKTSSYEW